MSFRSTERQTPVSADKNNPRRGAPGDQAYMADRYYYSGVRRSCPVFQTDITELTYFTSRVSQQG